MERKKMEIEYDKVIGARVKEAREAAKLGTQKDLATTLNYSPSLISQIEQGKRALPMNIAYYLADKSGFMLEYILHKSDFRTKEELVADTLSRVDFLRTWSDGFLKMIAEDREYDVSQENKNYIFTDINNSERKIVVPEEEIKSFKDEIRLYGLFRFELLIDAHSHKSYMQKTKEEKK